MDASSHTHLETDLWRWLLFHSGLRRRRARHVILQHGQSQALSLFFQQGPMFFVRQLGLTEEEEAALQERLADWAMWQSRMDGEREQGLVTVRINEPGYPPTLLRHLAQEQRPLLVFWRGEGMLLEMPLVLVSAASTPSEEAVVWAQETLLALAEEGMVPLLVARPGYEARLARVLLEGEVPFVLVIPQGLMAYEPPSGLARAMDASRTLLVSPFQPDWKPEAADRNPMLPHAVSFAQALASAQLALTPGIEAVSPCFAWPELVSGDCEPYQDPEILFLRLAEAAVPAPTVQITPQPEPVVELPPLRPEEILATLAQGGRVPEALARRLKEVQGD